MDSIEDLISSATKSEHYLVKAALNQVLVVQLLLERGVSPEEVEETYNKLKNALIENNRDLLEAAIKNIENGKS